MLFAFKRTTFILIGLIATGLAIAGAFVPGLPTTVFVIIALWAFARSSKRLHAWLCRIPVLSVALKEAKRFEDRRAISLRVKYIACGFAWLSFILVVLTVSPGNTLSPILVGLAALSCTLFMLYMPTDER